MLDFPRKQAIIGRPRTHPVTNMVCPQCNFANRETSAQCEKCATPLQLSDQTLSTGVEGWSVPVGDVVVSADLHAPLNPGTILGAPPANHPWYQAVRREVQKRASQLAATASRSTLAALRASQGCAPDQASKQRDAVGRARWESSFLELPGASFFEQNHPGKKKRQNRKKGTFLTR
jgi:hypothetical protein